MNASTWTAVTIGGSLTALALLIFVMSLVPGLFGKIRDELASWPDQARELPADLRSFVRRGRHAGYRLAADAFTPQSPSDPPRALVELEPSPAQVIRDDEPVVHREVDERGLAGYVHPESTVAQTASEWLREHDAEYPAAPAESALVVQDDDTGEQRVFESEDAYWASLDARLDALVARADAVMSQLDARVAVRYAVFEDVPTGEYRLVGASA